MSMKELSKLLPILIALGVSGCGTSAEMKSAKSASYNDKPKRLLILANLGAAFQKNWALGTPGEALRARSTQSLAACGVTSNFEPVDPASIQPTIDRMLPQFAPDAVIVAQWTTQQTNNVGLIKANYHLEMTDVKTKAVVWKANMEFALGETDFGEQRVTVFLKTLIDKLKADDILPANCTA